MLREFRNAMEAADYAIAKAEASADRLIGAKARVKLSRILSATILGAPVAWFIAGMHWNSTAVGGLIAGVALFALLDSFRSSFRRRKLKSQEPN